MYLQLMYIHPVNRTQELSRGGASAPEGVRYDDVERISFSPDTGEGWGGEASESFLQYG
jgi:hypothetical protein